MRSFVRRCRGTTASGPSATHHPSKPLHARSSPPCLHGSPGLLPSCRSPSLLALSREVGSTPGFYSAGRVHGLPRTFRPSDPYSFLGFLLLSGLVVPRASRPLPRETVGLGVLDVGGVNRAGSGARCSFQPFGLTAWGLSRPAPSRSDPFGIVPCPVPHRDRPGWGLGRLWSSRVAGPVVPSSPPHGEGRRMEGTGTRRGEGSAG